MRPDPVHWARMAAIHSLRALVREGLVRLRPAPAHWCFTHQRVCRMCEVCGPSAMFVDVDLASSEALQNEVS